MMMTRQTHTLILLKSRGFVVIIAKFPYVFSAPSSVLNCSYYIFNEIIKFWKCKEPNHIYIEKKIIVHLIHFTVWNTLYIVHLFLWMRNYYFFGQFPKPWWHFVFYIKSYYGVVFSWNGKTQLSSSI